MINITNVGRILSQPCDSAQLPRDMVASQLINALPTRRIRTRTLARKPFIGYYRSVDSRYLILSIVNKIKKPTPIPNN